jgi:hypothetical protein
MSIALERAKPPAPVWRCYSGKQAFGRSSFREGWEPGVKLANR